MDRTRALAAGLLLLALAGVQSGCMCDSSARLDNVTFAADGSRVAYTFRQSSFAALDNLFIKSRGLFDLHLPIIGFIDSKDALYVTGVSSGDRPNRVCRQVESAACLFGRSSEKTDGKFPSRFSLSPDGRYLSGDENGALVIRETSGGTVVDKLPLPEGGKWNDWVWCSPEHLACCLRSAGDDVKPSLRIVRRKVGMLSQAGEELAHWESRGSAYWSPTRRYVAVDADRIVGLFDLHTGQFFDIQSDNRSWRGISWRYDESAVLLSHEQLRPSPVPGEQPDYRIAAILTTIQLPDGGTKEWRTDKRWLVFEPSERWTADNLYVPADQSLDGEHTPVLLDPARQRVIDLGAPLRQALNLPVPLRLRGVKAFPVPGWLLLGDGSFDSDVFDYGIRHIVALSEGAACGISPDGRLLARDNGWGGITIRPIELPPLPTTQPAQENTAP